METSKSGESSVFVDKYLTPIALIVAAIILAGAFVYGKGGPDTEMPPDQQGKVAVDVKALSTEGVPFIGEANAPTTVAVFVDYQCPFCKQFEQAVTPKIIEAYVKSGKTKILFKDFQFLGDDSNTAALFGRAVWEQAPDQFYAWYMAVFNAQDKEGDEGFGDLASIKTVTATIPGIDIAAVEKLMTDKKSEYTAAIERDRAEGSSMGINGTPSIIVGKKLFTGMSPEQFYTQISATIDAELAAQ